jgi:hypothetical protein
MKVNKLLPIAAIFGCYVFGSVAIAQQVCPVGAGACTARTLPASSYSNSRAVDIMIRPPVPVLPTPGELALQIAPLLPPSAGPSGIFCGRAAVFTDSMGVTERSPCQGHLVAYQAPTEVWIPASGGTCDESGNSCSPYIPGYVGISYVFAADCPAGFGLISTGSSGPYQYFSCIKS